MLQEDRNMDCDGAVYAKFPDGGIAALEEAIKNARAAGKEFSPLKVLGGDPAVHQFAVVDRWNRTDYPPMWVEASDPAIAKELAELSAQVGEVIAFYLIDGGLTSGIYAAWSNGNLVRNLQWGDFMWLVAEGEQQPWEKPLFSPQELEASLEAARDDGLEDSEALNAFVGSKIAPMAHFPRPNNLIRYINEACPGPRYGFQPWPKRSDLVKELNPKTK